MRTGTIIGIIFIVGALLKLAAIWNIISLQWLSNQPWTSYILPCILLYIGASLVVKSFCKDREQWLRRPIPDQEEGRRILCSTKYGGDEYVYNGESFHGARLEASFGGIKLDLRNAVINEDEEIDIHTSFGGVELYVPENVNVLVKSRSFFGGVGNESLSTNDQKLPTLYIVASNFFGGVSIKN